MSNDIHNWDIGSKSLSLLHRQEDRTDAEFSSHLANRNGLEDLKAQQIMVAHNRICDHTKMSVKPMGDRSGTIHENIPKDEGDSVWTFIGKISFTVCVEIKMRDGKGHMFRPRWADLIKCAKYNRPYVLLQNCGTPYERIVILDKSDCEHILKTKTPILSEKGRSGNWSPYNHMKEYVVLDHREYKSVMAKDLSPIENWMDMLKTLQSMGSPLKV